MKEAMRYNWVIIFASIQLSILPWKAKGQEPAYMIAVDLNKAEEAIRWTDFVDSVTYVVLDTQPLARVQSIDAWVPTDQGVLVLDKKGKAVICFDKYGRYIYRIDQTTHPESPFVQPTSLHIMEDQNQLEVFDFKLQKMFQYDLRTGNYQGIISLGSGVIRSIWGLGKQGYLCYNYNEHPFDAKNGIWAVNKNGELIKALGQPIFNNYEIRASSLDIYQVGEAIHLFGHHDNRVYQVNTDSLELEVIYEYQFQGGQTPADFDFTVKDTAQVISCVDHWESEHWLYSIWVGPEDKQPTIYQVLTNKDSHETKIFKGQYNDIDIMIGLPIRCNNFQGKIASMITKEMLERMIDRIPRKYIRNINDILRKKLTFQNPVIQVIWLKG